MTDAELLKVLDQFRQVIDTCVRSNGECVKAIQALAGKVDTLSDRLIVDRQMTDLLFAVAAAKGWPLSDELRRYLANVRKAEVDPSKKALIAEYERRLMELLEADKTGRPPQVRLN